MENKKHILFAISLVGLSCLKVSSAFGWGDIGHQTVAEIASRNISPHTQQMIESILGPEPLAAAAIWPDIVRSDKRFSAFVPYHFVEVTPGYTYETEPKEMRSEQDGATVIFKFPKIVNSKKATRAEKMIALRYLVHVIGDVHQPLHVGNGIDVGANLCQVRVRNPWTNEVRFTNLHTVWDEDIIEFIKESQRQLEVKEAALTGSVPPKRFFGYFEFANRILKTHKEMLSSKREIQSSRPEAWFDETAKLRTESVYPDFEAGYTARPDDMDRNYCGLRKEIDPKGEHKITQQPILDQNYMQARVPIIETQILKGGLRLAKFLDDMFKDQKPSQQRHLLFFKRKPVGTKEILDKLNLKND